MNPYFILVIFNLSFLSLINWIAWSNKYDKYFYFSNFLLVVIRVLQKCIYDIIYYNQTIDGIPDLLLTLVLNSVILSILQKSSLLIIFGLCFSTITFNLRYTFYSDEYYYINVYILINRIIFSIVQLVLLTITKYKLAFKLRQEFLLDIYMN